jgi:hypothetical protein
MSIQAPQGILNIPNATLRVGKLAVDSTAGFDTVFNNVERNTILLEDSTEYTDTKQWDLKMPNIFVATFEIKGDGSSFNFRNTSNGDATTGYTLTFSGTTLTLKYDNASLTTATIPNLDSIYGKIYLTYEKQHFTVTVDGTLVLNYKDTTTRTPPEGEYANFFAGTGSPGFKNLKVVAGHFISDGTSNIAYVGGGEVAVGKALAFNRVSNVSQIKVDSNVVTEYTGPHDRPLRKYPEVALTANDNSSTSGYVADQTAFSGNADGYAYRLFDHSLSTAYQSGGSQYSSGDSTGSAQTTTATDGTTHQGVAITLDLATKIRLSYAKITSHTYYGRTPVEGTFLGSNNNSTWDVIGTFSGLSTTAAGQTHTVHISDYATKSAYRYIRLVVTKIHTSAVQNGGTLLEFRELEYYGYEEGSGSLDTTLKSVYNVPATTGTQLEVYYDAKDYSSLPATVTDKVGTATNATISNSGGTITFDSTYKAWTFGGDTTRTDTFISAALPSSFVDNQSHSVSLWFNPSYIPPVTSSFGAIFSIALATGEANSQNIQIQLNGSDTFSYVFWNNDEGFDVPMGKSIAKGQWYHLSATYEPSTGTRNIFLNGEKCVSNGIGGANPGADLDIQSGSVIKLGARINGTQEYFGSIANFRLYSKALNADQVKELYDYQKDYFLGSKSQVTLYKGHLGVGVTEPSGQLELAGDERIQEYPPRGMTHSDGTAPDAQVGGKSKNITYIEGHGEFKASASKWSTGTSGYDGQQPYNAFDKTTTRGWLSYDNLGYNNTTGAYEDNEYILSASSGTPYGHWLKLEMPYTINIKSYFLDGSSRNYSPHDWQIWASNDDNSWTHIHSYSGETYDDSNGRYYTVSHAGHYKMFAIIVTSIHPGATHNGSPTDRIWIREMKYFGTPGPTTLDKGSLSLGRSLDVPRVSRYDVDTETPRPEKLVLDFDTTVNSSPTDISGQGNHGRFVGTAQYSPADKAFVFDGNSDYIQGTLNLNGSELNTSYTLSMWVKSDSTANDTAVFMFIGSSVSGDAIGFRHNNNISSGGTEYRLYHFGVTDTSATSQPTNLNQWRHLVAMYDGTNHKIFVDGVLAVTGAASDLNTIPNSPTYSIGYRWNGGSADEYFDGMVSNPKLYSVALEPSEVRKLYNLGRTGRSMVISDTAVGIGKVPEANLDVRGSLAVRGGNVMIGQADIQVRLATDPGYLTKIDGGSMFIANPSTSGGYEHFIMNNSTTGSHQTTYFSFRRNNGQIGSILTTNGSLISFNTGSDYRLKENIVDMPDIGLEIINKLRPKTFNFKKYPGETVHGFIAHELQEHIPIAVSGEKDEMRGEEPMYQGVDASKIVPWLVKAIQELYEENQTLKTRLDTLEGA